MNQCLTIRGIFVALLFLCVQPFAFAESASGSNEGLTEKKVLSFLKVQEDAYLRGDTAAFIATLADNYTGMSGGKGRTVPKQTRGEIEAMLVKVFPLLSNINISHEDRVITISQDGRSGSVAAKNFIRYTVGDKNVSQISLSTDTFELRGDQILTTTSVETVIEQKVTMAVWDIAERPADCTYYPEDEKVAQYDIGQYHSKSKLAGLFGMTNPVPFCRMYQVDAKTVSAVIQSIIFSLGNPIKALLKNAWVKRHEG